MHDKELEKEHDQTWRAAMQAKKRLQEMVLTTEALNHSEIDALRTTYFTNLARYKEISAQFEALRQADIQRRQAKREARRVEAANWSKSELMAATGLTRKDWTRAQLIESYASMAG